MATNYFRTSGVLSSTYKGVEYQPSVKMDFLYNNKLDPRLIFSRSTSATYINSIGNFASAASGTHRIDYDPVTLERKGFLIEEYRTNLVQWSADPNQSTWTSSSGPPTITALSSVGIFTPTRIASIGTNWHRRQTNGLSLTASTKYSVKIIFKPGTSGNIWTEFRYDASNTFVVTGSVDNPTVTNNQGFTINTDPEVKIHKSGLYELTYTVTPSLTQTYYLGIGPNSTVVGEYIDLYGVQVEVSQRPTSFIVTSNIDLFRDRDTCYMDNIQNIVTDQATLICDTIMSSSSNSGFVASLFTTATNYLGLGYSGASGAYLGNTYYVNGTTYNSALPNVSYGDYDIVTRIACGYDSSDVVTYYSGNRLAHSTTFPGAITPQRLYLGARSGSGDFDSNVWMRKVYLYDKKIEEEDMLYLTRI